MVKANGIVVYQPAFFPRTCYVLEAAEWIAFGRVPDEIWYGDEEQVEYRDGPGVPWGDDVYRKDLWFREQEFHWFNVPVDYKRYNDAMAATLGVGGQAHLADFEKNFGNYRDFKRPGFTEEAQQAAEQSFREWEERVQAEAAEADWAKAVELPLLWHLDQAKTTVFQMLQAGKLTAIGWLPDPNAKEEHELQEDELPAGKWMEVPRTVWISQFFDWDTSELRTAEGRLRAVQVQSRDLTELFPFPSTDPQPVTANLHCNTLVRRADGDEMPRPTSGRGRPPKGGLPIRDVVQNFFKDRVDKANTSSKTEALVQEVIDFVKKSYKVDIGRSTAQEYLAPLTRVRGNRVPEIDAGKYAANQ